LRSIQGPSCPESEPVTKGLSGGRTRGIAVRTIGAACVCLILACTEAPTRMYATSDVVGEYVRSGGVDEGVVLEANGQYRHCWRKGALVGSEKGEWMFFGKRGHAAVTLFNFSIRQYGDKSGLGDLGMLVGESGSRMTLEVDMGNVYYYVKQVGSGAVCKDAG